MRVIKLWKHYKHPGVKRKKEKWRMKHLSLKKYTSKERCP